MLVNIVASNVSLRRCLKVDLDETMVHLELVKEN